MSEKKPECFGWVNASREDLAQCSITIKDDCKTCKFLGPCTAEYNQREYNQWFYEEPDEEDPEDESRAIALAHECFDPGYGEDEDEDEE